MAERFNTSNGEAVAGRSSRQSAKIVDGTGCRYFGGLRERRFFAADHWVDQRSAGSPGGDPPGLPPRESIVPN